ncbi:flagellar assembly protein T N-terminal domain-containing protein [Chitinibacter bivalviorum]|uniref:Flagellar assembly protein T N-terminal domain-containing protein n=1 Tax=Chitinibacter bivalviorum TaxID=2739434 RepID=A0A7H9BEL2_9NEIS|nr:flagellar assembly protein T N-terminal domain-containing protein [Chitinibacter bivalviorum]QLG86852.1 flagellar assembly protein T N-terminal domain-containing protein [Chitinibacter bivalviorum]
MGLMCAQPALAVQQEGIAPVGSEGLAVARQAAIADALENAALFNGASVKSGSQKTGQTWAESAQVRGAPVGDYQLIREWQSNGFVHVIIDVAPPAVAAATNTVATPETKRPALCSGSDFKRKVLITNFWVQRPAQASDLDRFPEGLQLEMLRQFYASGSYFPQRSGAEAVLDVQPQYVDPILQPDRVRDLARRYAVQFVVGGIVRDISTSGERYTTTHGNDVRPGERKLELNLPLISFTQFGLKATPSSRRFEYELFVFDGVSGALINRHRLAGTATGSVAQDPATSMGTMGFQETDFGKLVQTKLQEGTNLAIQDLSCIPFSARVTRVEKGRVYFDAGVTSKVAVGDTLQVYRISPSALLVPAASYDPAMSLGLPEDIVGSLNVVQVQPLFSVGQVSGANVLPGDYVRFVGQEKKR